MANRPKWCEMQEVLDKEGMTLIDYDPTVFVVVGGELLADSEDLESAQELVDRARGYGEDAWLFEWKGEVRCEADAKRGTGTGVCDTPLDAHAQCPRAGQHV